MAPLDVTWRHSLSVFWLILWRGFLGAMLMGGVIGFGVGLSGVLLDLPRGEVALANGGIGAVLGIVWTIAVVGMALRKRYRGFRIILVAT